MVFEEYKIRFTLIEPMLGTVPKNPDIYRDYIAAKTQALRGQPSPMKLEEELKTIENAVKSAEKDAEAEGEKLELSGWTGFHEDEKGIFIYDYLIKGFLKEAGRALSTQLKLVQPASKIDTYVFVSPRRIYLAKKPAGYIERPLRGMTMQGPRVTIVRSDYVDAGTQFEATIKILKNTPTAKSAKLDGKILKELLNYGRFKALGQFRNGGYGSFTYEILEEKEDIVGEDTRKTLGEVS